MKDYPGGTSRDEETDCLICGNRRRFKTLTHAEDMISGESFAIVECPACSALRTFPVPDNLQKYYDTDMGKMMVEAPSRSHAFLKRFLLRKELKRILAHFTPGTFVDVGCGSGDFSCEIHSHGYPVIALDAGAGGPKAIQQIQTISYRQIDFDRGEIEGGGDFGHSVAILRHVLEHVRDPGRFLARLVEYGVSYFYIVVPNSGSVERRLLGPYWGFWDPPRHLWHFNPRSLGFLFHRLNMEVVQSGFDTIPNIIPSLYRFLRLKQFTPRVYEWFTPKGFLSSLSAPFNFLLPWNVAWVVVKVNRSPSNGTGR